MGAGDDVAQLKKKCKKEEELRKNFADLAKKREDELKKRTAALVLAQSQLKEVQEKSAKEVKVAVQRKDNKINALEAKVKELNEKLAS